jgi:hypothetical protein
MGCPAITFASANHKVHGACELLDGVNGTPHDGTDLRSQLDAIEDQAREYVADRSGFKNRLLDVCRRLQPEALQLGEVAADALRKRSAGGSPGVSGRETIDGRDCA